MVQDNLDRNGLPFREGYYTPAHFSAYLTSIRHIKPNSSGGYDTNRISLAAGDEGRIDSFKSKHPIIEESVRLEEKDIKNEMQGMRRRSCLGTKVIKWLTEKS